MPARRPPYTGGVSAPSPATILIVEDDPLAQAAEGFALHQAGYRVLGAASLADARQRLAAGPPDLVLLDLGLPDGSGLTLTRQLAAVRVPVVIVTSRAALSERVLGLTLGAQDYLTKPLGLAELVACVAAVLRRATDRPRFAERG